ncbi:SRPBCC family protein [Streptomyces sp. NPDC047725]|uniref:SRPBCC family protein n=1 Tax=Streptomyces sp. NPDC047725 TaxID=3365487 RepID=UPI003716D77A
MSTTQQTIQVAVPLRTAYNQWTQFTTFPRFMTVVKGVEQVRPTLTHWVLGIGPVRRRFAAEILEQEPDTRLVWRTLDSRHEGDVTFRSSGPERTMITVRVRIGRGGIASALLNVTGLTRRVVGAELTHFKEFIEGLGQEVGAWRGTIRNGHVRPLEPEPPRSRVPRWPVG